MPCFVNYEQVTVMLTVLLTLRSHIYKNAIFKIKWQRQLIFSMDILYVQWGILQGSLLSNKQRIESWMDVRLCCWSCHFTFLRWIVCFFHHKFESFPHWKSDIKCLWPRWQQLLIRHSWLVALSEDRNYLLLQTVRATCLSKFPLGKVDMWQVYRPSSDTSVLGMSRAEFSMGLPLSNLTRPA